VAVAMVVILGGTQRGGDDGGDGVRGGNFG